MADSSGVASAIAAAIEQQKSYVTSKLQEVGPFTFENVLAYWKPAPDGNSYPLIMLQHIQEDFQWYSMPNNYMTIFQFDVYGMMRGADSEVLARAVEKFAAAIKDILLQRSMSLTLPDGSLLSFLDFNGKGYCPVQGIKYIEMLSNQGQLARGFRMRFKCSVITQAPDIDAYANQKVYPIQV